MAKKLEELQTGDSIGDMHDLGAYKLIEAAGGLNPRKRMCFEADTPQQVVQAMVPSIKQYMNKYLYFAGLETSSEEALFVGAYDFGVIVYSCEWPQEEEEPTVSLAVGYQGGHWEELQIDHCPSNPEEHGTIEWLEHLPEGMRNRQDIAFIKLLSY